jgi:hypothetical protein
VTISIYTVNLTEGVNVMVNGITLLTNIASNTLQLTMESPNALPDPADTARRAQDMARQRAQRETDTLLLIDMMAKDGENKVRQISTNKMKDQGVATLLQRAPTVRERLPGARTAQRVFMAQDSACLTVMTVQGESTDSLLPAGVPVIDHLAAWCTSNPGWDTLLPTINHLRTMRAVHPGVKTPRSARGSSRAGK